MAIGQEFLVNDLTDLWVHEKYNSRKIPVPLQCAHFFSITLSGVIQKSQRPLSQSSGNFENT